MIRAYELCSTRCEYPLHLGVTEAGTERMGLIKSSIGIGSLLQRGIGDTIRVSLTADPVQEVRAGIEMCIRDRCYTITDVRLRLSVESAYTYSAVFLSEPPERF